MDAIISHGPISRAQIAKLTQISKQTASEVIRELETSGWVQVHGQTRGGIGRTAVTYTIRPEAAYVAGVDLGGTQLRMAIADLACTVVAEASEPTDPRGAVAVVDQIAALADRLARDHGIAREHIRLLVVGTPGILDPATGSIRVAPNITGLDRIDVVALLGEAFGVDVIVENDVNIGALGERWLGRARGIETFVYIALGTGLGMGIVADGRIIRGARGGAGEIANLPIGGDPRDPANRLHGTLETAIGSAGIVARYVAAGGAPALSGTSFTKRLFWSGIHCTTLPRIGLSRTPGTPCTSPVVASPIHSSTASADVLRNEKRLASADQYGASTQRPAGSATCSSAPVASLVSVISRAHGGIP